MIKPQKILPVFASLSLLAQGPLALAQTATGAGVQTSDVDKVSQAAAVPVTTPAPAKHVEKMQEKSTKSKGAYIKQEPVSDTSGSPTRVHRPGQDDAMPPTAPQIGSGTPTSSPMPLLKTPPTAPPREKFPSVGQLEQLMFGHSTPNIAVENRLDKLETAIFQRPYPELDIEQRIHKLKDVIVGEEPRRSADPSVPDLGSTTAFTPPLANPPYSQKPSMAIPPVDSVEPSSNTSPTFPNYGHFDLNQQLSQGDAEKFGLEVVNEIREQQGANDLVWDEVASKVASEQVKDLIHRNAVSHQNSKGENPDVRYTFAGGSDALVENTIMFPAADNLRSTRELVVKILESLLTRQDDREALMFEHASGFGMSFQWSADHKKLVCCTEILTKHGQMEPIPLEASVGDKIEVKGTVAAPYKFHKITVAWEGLSSAPPDDDSEANEALPYFPPLDYEAHSTKSSRDYEKGIRILQIAGITAAIAGGLFIPPVAMAAPLIAASMGPGTPKPVSEIPVRGGVKTDGTNFTHKVTLNNQGKEGIYYLTVWASTGAGNEILPVSRRAIIARKDHASGSEKDSGEAAAAEQPKVEVKIEQPNEAKSEQPKGEENKDGEKQKSDPGK